MKKFLAAALSLALALPINLAAQNGQSAASAIADSRTIVDRRAKAAIKECVQKMTLRQKIGSLCVMNFRFWTDAATRQEIYEPALAAQSPEIFQAQNTINSSIYKTVKDYNIGSVILFGENMTDPQAAKKFIQDLNKAALDGNNSPLLFFADQEGGNVLRAYDFSTPSAMAIGQTGNAENAFLCGKANGELLLDYGINVDLAPVCDIASNPQNPVIGIRSFSSDKDKAADFSRAFSKGLLSAGVLSCAKHFPGHGDTAQDSHLALPSINSAMSKWKKNEAIPFKANIQDGIPLIMTAHIQCPKLDKTKIPSEKTGKEIIAPATLSKKILTKILRGSLGYKGAIISDAMDMKAICDNWSPEESFALAVNAGCDLIINPINVHTKKDLEFLEDFFKALEEMASDGRLEKKALDQAAARVLELKERAGLIKIQDGKIISLEQKSVPMEKQKKREAALLSNEIQTLASRSTFTNKKNPLPVRGKKLLIYIPYEDKIEVLQKAFAARSVQSLEFISYEGKSAAGKIDRSRAKKADMILVFTQLNGAAVQNKKLWPASFPASLAKEIKKAGAAEKTFAVSMNLPYDKKLFPKEEGFSWAALYNYTQIGYARAVQALFD